MGGFGEKLRREREMRGITLEEIAEATKIGSRSLTALETEDFDKLPGGIFNKGFVRSYARYLGIDEEQAVADFLSAEAVFRKGGPPPSPAISAAPGEDTAERPPRRTPAAPVAVVLIVVLAGFAAWRVVAARRAARPESPPRQAASRPVVPPATATPTPPPTSSNGAAANVSPAPDHAANATPPQAANTAPAQQGGGSQSAPGNPTQAAPSITQAVTLAAQPGTATPPTAANDAFTIRVHAREEAWVSLTADGKPVPSSVLKPGEERQVEAHRRVILKTGNAGGVDVTLNGKPLAFSARPNEVKTLVFNSQGVEQQ